MQIGNVYEKPLGYVQITGLTAAKGLGAIPPGTKLILIQPETQSIRWRDDGTAPTATVGYPLAAGAELRYTGWDAGQAAFSMIQQSATAIVNVTFYGLGQI